MNKIEEPGVLLDISSGNLSGKEIHTSEKKIRDMDGVFHNEVARTKMNQDTLVYVVQIYRPVKEGTTGGLFFGNTTLYPGKVGDEYFMTRGHYHETLHKSEFYWCISGHGVLICMDLDREIRTETMKPGSLHYIEGKVAHRVANIGKSKLVFNACWPSDAGHDYKTITDLGFRARMIEKGNKPELVTL